jgi:hypothetical protein
MLAVRKNRYIILAKDFEEGGGSMWRPGGEGFGAVAVDMGQSGGFFSGKRGGAQGQWA